MTAEQKKDMVQLNAVLEDYIKCLDQAFKLYCDILTKPTTSQQQETIDLY